MADSIRDTVLRLHQDGYSTIPLGLGEDGKGPRVKWGQYKEKQPPRLHVISWESRWKPKLWAIVMSETVALIDADTEESYAKLKADLGEPHVISPRPGGHWYIDTTGHPLKSATKPLPGIDVKGIGGLACIVGKSKKGEYQIQRLPLRSELIPYDDLPEWIKEGLEAKPGAIKALDGVPEGERDVDLYKYACRLFGKGLDQTEVTPLILIAAAKCKPPFTEKDALAKVESASKYEVETKEPLELRRIDEIETREVEWLWNPYIPLGKLTLLEGDPGEGKSWISLAIATRITLEDLGGPANVLIASAEDDFDDTIRPRLEELGANLGLVYAIEEAFTLGTKKGLNDNAFDMLEKHLREKEPTLVIIDPLTAYLGSGVDMHRQNETRPVMARLASLAREYNCAILLIRHINKGGSAKPIYRGMGSIDFTASARSVLLAGHVDREDGSMERALVHIKSNLAPLGTPIGFILGHPFQWTDSTLTANEILNQPISGGKKTDEAVALIRELLAGGEAVDAKEILATGKEAGISERTMRNAKKALHVKSGGKGGKDKRWHWYIPKGGEVPPGIEPIAVVKDGRISVDLNAV